MDAWLLSWKQAVNKVDPFMVLAEVLTKHHVDIIDLNQEQLDQGIKSTGDRLTDYSDIWARIRKKKGLQVSNKDLKFTGKLRNKMYVSPYKMYTEIGSKDPKAGEVEDMNSNDIWSLTPENMDKLLWERGVADDFITLYTSKLIAA